MNSETKETLGKAFTIANSRNGYRLRLAPTAKGDVEGAEVYVMGPDHRTLGESEVREAASKEGDEGANFRRMLLSGIFFLRREAQMKWFQRPDLGLKIEEGLKGYLTEGERAEVADTARFWEQVSEE